MSPLLFVISLVCLAAPCFCQWSAKQSEVLGCSQRSLYCRGQPFDDFHTGFNGAVAAICVGKSREEDTGARGLPYIEVSYAGQYVGHGGLESPQRHGKACYNLGMGEVITKVEVEVANNSEDNRIQSLRFTSNIGRSSDWFGRAHDNGPQDAVKLLTPQSNNTHLVAVHGFGQNIDMDDRAIEGFGVYWGSGGGSGYWKPSLSCIGCSSWSFEYKYGTDHREMEDPDAWAASVTQEMGFSFAGFSSTKIEQDYAKLIMQDTKESFLTDVQLKSYTCNSTYLYQWVLESRFDTPSSPTTTYTSFMVCTEVAPCCLPFTFSKDPTKCDLQPDAPNQCHLTRHESTSHLLV